MTELKQGAEESVRKMARGRSQDTPVLVQGFVFLVVGAFVAVVTGIVLLIYYLG